MPQPATDVAIIGAGPAGMAAAVAAAENGARVVLIDAGQRMGGQYWRHSQTQDSPHAPAPPWHHGWRTYQRLASRVRSGIAAGSITYLPNTHVWALDGLCLLMAPTQESMPNRQSVSTLRAQSVVLAPGAFDRHLPVPGWTLPGVMAAGGIQAFVKVNGTLPGRRVLLAGTGPFLLAAAATVLHAGGEVVAVCESTNLTGWFPRGVTAGLVPSKGVEGAEYVALLARHRVPYLRRRVIAEVVGTDRVRSVVTSRVDVNGRPVAGDDRVFDGVDVVGLGWGFVPQAELLLQTGATVRVDVDGSLVGVVNAVQESSVPGVFLAGEITGVTGAVGALAEGRIAGRAAAAKVVTTSAKKVRDFSTRLTRARHQVFGRAMNVAHPVPAGWTEWVRPETVVCRCEEVSFGEVTAAQAAMPQADPRALKGETRAGMGPCQGRMCGFAMSCLAATGAGEAGERGESPDGQALIAAQQVNRRLLAMPVTLGALAGATESTGSTN